MKTALPIWLALMMVMVIVGCNRKPEDRSGTQVIENQLVDLSCGQCQFGMQGDGCDLAIRHDSKSYFVSGSGIDDHGDAHADEGLCNCVRQARVSGTIRAGTFHVRSIDVLDAAANSE